MSYPPPQSASTSQNDPCPDPCTHSGPHPCTLDHHFFRPASVTLKMGKHEAVDLLVHSQNPATPPATAFVTSPPRFRFHHLQKVQTPSTAVRVRAIAHFACSPLCSHHDPSRSFSYLAFVPHLAVFSYLAFCPYLPFLSPSRCLLLSCLLLQVSSPAPNHHRLLTPHMRPVPYTLIPSFCRIRTNWTPSMSSWLIDGTGFSVSLTMKRAKSER